MQVLLISTYDMGRQSFGLASPAAWLREAGLEVVCADLSRDRLPQDAVRAASLAAFFLPMHTATRLALPVIDRVRSLNPEARLVAYGLYAPLNDELLRARGIHDVLGGEFEQQLVDIVRLLQGVGGEAPPNPAPSAEHRALSAESPAMPRLAFKVPAREGLPPLSRYAALQDGPARRVVGYTEASRGCKHLCRHCPIVPVYNGRFRVVSPDVVLADVRGQIGAGATHITFGDPDFFNGIRHAREVMERFAQECPQATYDVTIKVEHLLKHADALEQLHATGCAFVTTAVEAVDDRVLGYLDKGHTRADFERAVALCAQVDLPLSPTFVAFTPWTTIASYGEFLQAIDNLGLVEHVAPIQLAIRLLVTEKSRLLELHDVRSLVRAFDPLSLTYPWRHPAPAVDALQLGISRIVGVRPNAAREDVFAQVWELAVGAGEPALARRRLPVLPARASIPYLTEPWYC
ncbi:MAG: radical SAM protein [Acidobacteria bacterium]|nr:radical SAM protein [Acidobacteriota bacterium]